MIKNRPWASLVAQSVKNLPAVQETWIQSCGWEDPWRREWQPTQYSGLENPMDRGAWWATWWDHKESDTTDRLNTHTVSFIQLPFQVHGVWSQMPKCNVIIHT